MRVSGAPSPRHKMSRPALARSSSPRVSGATSPREQSDTRVITRETLCTRTLEDLPSKYFFTLLLARALDQAPRVTAKTAHLIVYSKWVHYQLGSAPQ